jgi:uridine kinase
MANNYNSISEAIKRIKFSQFKVIGISGGSCSGKTYFAKLLENKLHSSFISMDDYYIGIRRMKSDNFDHPNAIDIKLWIYHLKQIKEGKEINRPIYNFKNHEREGFRPWRPKFPIIAEGLFTLLPPHSSELSLKIFIMADSESRLKRRILRDTTLRGRYRDDVINQWYKSVEPMYKKYGSAQYHNADIIIINQ